MSWRGPTCMELSAGRRQPASSSSCGGCTSAAAAAAHQQLWWRQQQPAVAAGSPECEGLRRGVTRGEKNLLQGGRQLGIHIKVCGGECKVGGSVDEAEAMWETPLHARRRSAPTGLPPHCAHRTTRGWCRCLRGGEGWQEEGSFELRAAEVVAPRRTPPLPRKCPTTTHLPRVPP